MGAMRHTPHGSFVNMWDANVEGGRAYLEAARQLILCKVRCTFKILSSLTPSSWAVGMTRWGGCSIYWGWFW